MSSRPVNVLMIVSDQHSVRALGCYGNSVVATPHLDALAEAGTAFNNAHCQSPLCVPSRTSLLTGQYCRQHGVYDNQHILEANSVTLPRWLGAHGYRTCLIGKAHFNGEQYHGYQQRPCGDLWGQAHQPDPVRTVLKGEAGLGDLIGESGRSGIPLALTQTRSAWPRARVGSLNTLTEHPSSRFCFRCTSTNRTFRGTPP